MMPRSWRRLGSFALRSRYRMWPCPDPRRRLILAHLEYAASRFGLGDRAPPRNKGAGEAHVRDVDGDRLTEHPSRPREVSSPSRRRRHGSIVAQTAGKWCPLALCWRSNEEHTP